MLDLTGSDKIQTGVLDNTATFGVSGLGNEIDNEIAFTNSGTIELKPSAQLTLTGDTVNNTGAFITVDAHTATPATTLTLGSTTVSNGTVTNNDTLDLVGSDKIQTGVLDNTAALDVSGLGNEIDNETAFTNSGALEVLAGGALTLNTDQVTNAGGTIKVDTGTPGGTLTINDTTITDGTITNNATLDLTGDTIQILTTGALTNTATFDVSGLGNEIDGETAFTNSGTLEVLAGGALTLNTDQVTNAGGTIKVDTGTLTLNSTTITGGTLDNSGTLAAVTGSSTISSAMLNNADLISVQSGTLTIETGNTIDNAGTLAAANGGILDIMDAIIGTGTVSVGSHGILEIDAAETVGVTFNSDATGTVKFENPSVFAFSGTIAGLVIGDTIDLANIPVANVASANLSGSTLTVDISGGTPLTYTVVGALSGNGFAIASDNNGGTDLTLVHSADWVGDTLQETYYFPNFGTAYYTSPTFVPPSGAVVGIPDAGGVFTLAVTASTITAAFSLTGIWTNAAFSGFDVMDLTNNPLISSVTIDPSTNMVGLTSNDIFFDSNSVWINWEGLGFTASTVVKLDVTFDPPLDPSQVSIAQTIDGSIVPATNAADLSVINGTELALAGTVDNTGTITVDGSDAATAIGVEGTVTLDGGGHIDLSSSNENYIFGSALINVDNTISGGGDIGNGSMIFENAGTVVAQGPYALIIDTGANAFVNTGIIETNSGTLVVDSPVAGHGHAVIDGGTLEFSKASDNNVVFSPTSPGTLVLDQSENFSGHIFGFGNHDQIDLGDVAFSTLTSLTYSTGHLAVSNGNNSVSLSIEGSYSSSSFSISTDGHGGTLITEDPATNSAPVASMADQILQSNYAPTLSSSNSANQSVAVAVGGHGSDSFMFSSSFEPGTHTTEQWHNDASLPVQSPDMDSWQQLAASETPADHGTSVIDPTPADPANHGGVDPAHFYALMQSIVHLH